MDLVEQWIATWLHVRDITATEIDGWPLVHVDAPSRETEIVCLAPGPDELVSLLRHVAGDERAMLTVAAADVGPYRHLTLPGVRLDRDDETLMDADLSPVDATPLEPGFTFRWDVDEHRTTYTVESGQTIAAVGTIGILGDQATFDAVETMPAFQRRGLGRHVVATLMSQAAGRGATHGVLAATAQGSQLYSSLGWRTRLEMLSWMGTSLHG